MKVIREKKMLTSKEKSGAKTGRKATLVYKHKCSLQNETITILLVKIKILT